ncbi:ABC transporter substrate-binding protein [Paenibacillus eucommiae]|uniref:Iron complex transport system substrate-binding protein n=1 Tax=Paenibacillus eucommiae TaxID=1355755 RepID=A0ABS4J6Y7_9BACL|nr:ABC transporter substrate-binding protein [Paenibacillus eucommiae]MBP1995563.1 iron complex transport system substrate-binding protein [Paenibacillus eucommiae]
MFGRKWFMVVMVLAMIVMVAGCSGKNQGNTGTEAKETPVSTSVGSASDGLFPKTIKHMKGETVIKAKPIKIATPYIAFVDYLAVLDTYPVAAQGVETIGRGFPSLSKLIAGKEIFDLGQEVDMEKLLVSEPDVIIAANDMEDKYDQLSEMAPTVIFPQAGDWRETLQQIAEVIGKEDKAKSVLAEFDRKSAEYKTKLAFRSEESVLFTMYSGKEQFLTWEVERFDPFYKGLGLKTVKGAEKGGQLTLESLSALNPDHIFVINNWQDPIQGGVKEALKDSKVWNSMQAVKNNRVYYLEDPSIVGPLALAKIEGIEHIIKAMGK